MSKRERRWSWQVLLMGAAIPGAAVLGMWAWSEWHIKPWAASCGMATPGAFGDAFAPIVGVFTALALGATVASTYMQREAMREAQAQSEAQAHALERSLFLAVNAQVLEVTRQVHELDQHGCDAVQRLILEGDARCIWEEIVVTFPERFEVAKHLHRFNTGEVASLLSRRTRLMTILRSLADGTKRDAATPRSH